MAPNQRLPVAGKRKTGQDETTGLRQNTLINELNSPNPLNIPVSQLRQTRSPVCLLASSPTLSHSDLKKGLSASTVLGTKRTLRK